jgi:hypothetical protein
MKDHIAGAIEAIELNELKIAEHREAIEKLGGTIEVLRGMGEAPKTEGRKPKEVRRPKTKGRTAGGAHGVARPTPPTPPRDTQPAIPKANGEGTSINSTAVIAAVRKLAEPFNAAVLVSNWIVPNRKSAENWLMRAKGLKGWVESAGRGQFRRTRVFGQEAPRPLRKAGRPPGRADARRSGRADAESGAPSQVSNTQATYDAIKRETAANAQEEG